MSFASLRRPAGMLLAALVTVACGGDGSTGPKRGAAPVITAVAPATGTVGTELTITGTDFRAGATAYVGTTLADSASVAGPTTMYARVPAGVTAGQVYSVRVVNVDGAEGTRATAFTAVAPTLRFVNGATLPSGNTGSTVIVEGAAFGDRPGTGQVLFSNGAGGTVAATIADPANDWTNTFIVTTVPAGAATGPVQVTTGTGASNTLNFTITQNGAFSPSAIAWASATALPAAVSGHKAAFATLGGSNHVYVTGGAGADSVPTTSVFVSTVTTTLGAWNTTAALPVGLSYHATVVATQANSRVLADSGSIYVIGGATDKAGTPTSAVYRGRLNANGTVGNWVLTTPLPAAVHSMGAVIFRGEIYVAGGAGAGNAPVATVYRARIDSTGMLGAWQTLPSLPSARSRHALVSFGGFLYTFGGTADVVNPANGSTAGTRLNEVLHARINLRTGALAQDTWTLNGSGQTKSIAAHTVVAAGGSAFSTGGLYSGAAQGSSESSYATFNADGVVGSFTGATGSNTISSAGGGNLFNHAALAFIDGNGVAHVLVIGGDDVSSPGTKHAAVWMY